MVIYSILLEEVVVTNQESFSSKAVNETPSGMAISCEPVVSETLHCATL